MRKMGRRGFEFSTRLRRKNSHAHKLNGLGRRRHSKLHNSLDDACAGCNAGKISIPPATQAKPFSLIFFMNLPRFYFLEMLSDLNTLIQEK